MEYNNQMAFDTVKLHRDIDVIESLCGQLSKIHSGTKLLLKNQIQLILENRKLEKERAKITHKNRVVE